MDRPVHMGPHEQNDSYVYGHLPPRTQHRTKWIRANSHSPADSIPSRYIPTCMSWHSMDPDWPSPQLRSRPYRARVIHSTRSNSNVLTWWTTHGAVAAAAAEPAPRGPPHTTEPPPWNARFRVDVEGLTVARLYSRRSGASTRSPGHVLAGRKAPPITQPSGRAQEDPELAPSGWPAHQAQPLPWLFPNFRACDALPPAPSTTPCPIPSTRRRPPPSLPSPLPPCNPASWYPPFRSPPPPRRFSSHSTHSNPADRRDSYLIRYRALTGKIWTSSSEPQVRSEHGASTVRESVWGGKGHPLQIRSHHASSCVIPARNQAQDRFCSLIFFKRFVRARVHLLAELHFGICDRVCRVNPPK